MRKRLRNRLAEMFIAGGMLCPAAGTAVSQPVPTGDGSAAAAQILARATAAVAAQTVRPESFRKAGDPDDTGALQAALDTGKSVLLSDNHVYQISHVLIMRTGQRLSGSGPHTVLRATAAWPPPPRSGNGYTVVSNLHYSAPTTTDRGLIVENLAIDGSAVTGPNGGFHGIGFRQAADVVVRNVTCTNVGDCTAFEATTDTLVTDSAASGVTNVAFDHWEGPRNAIVTRSVVHVAPRGDGVMFTGAAGTWTTQRDRSGGHDVASHIQVYGPALAGVIANVLTPGSSLTDVTFEDCHIDLQNGPGSHGIVIAGNITNSRIDHAVIENLNGGDAIAVTRDQWNTPDTVTISNSRVANARTSERNVAPVVALGRHHRVVNVEITGGDYPYAVWTNDRSTTVDSHIAPGKHGGILLRPPP